MISERDEQQARLLEEYCQALMSDPSSLPPASLEAELARASQQLRQQLRAPLPSARFAAALQAQLEAESAAPATANEAEALPTTKPIARPVRVARSSLGWLAAAALIVLAVAGALYVASDLASRATRQSLPVQPEAHTAAEIIARAKAMYQSDAIKSFALTEDTLLYRGDQSHSEYRFFYQAPDRLRTESDWMTQIDDGKSVWNYNAPSWIDYGGDVSISVHNATPRIGSYQSPRNAIETVNYDLFDIDGCYQPTLRGKDVIAGRNAYVIDLGQTLASCKQDGFKRYVSRVMWIDRDSYFVLKDEFYSKGASGQLTAQYTYLVTSIQYNLPLSPNLFTFVMPKGVNVTDTRPMSGTNEAQLRAEVAEDASAGSLSTYLPTYVPKKLQASKLSYSAQYNRLDIIYNQVQQTPFHPRPPEGIIMPTMQFMDANLWITTQQATPAAVAEATKNLQRTVISNEQGWVGCIQPTESLPCSLAGSAAVVIRGSTLVTITGYSLPEDEVLKVAASLTPLSTKPPSDHAFPTMPPIPTPVPTEPGQDMPYPLPSVNP